MYEQNWWINEKCEGYYINDIVEKTLDKCHPNCRECDEEASINNTNCKSCYSDKYLFWGNCIDNCSHGYFTDNNDTSKKICKCSHTNCLYCSPESYDLDLCVTCNDNYYPIFYNDSEYPYNTFYNCTNNIEGYYLDSDDLFYKKCYKTCKRCNIKGDELNNNCLECNNFYLFKYDSIFWKWNCFF